MPTQLDILALEPFYGGMRRAMLDTVIRCSRHRWTLLKLPPRRMERRLSVAANWFAEQLSRHWSGKLDLLFTSEAMNLGSLYRLVPALATPPSVVYFHDNQLPDPQRIVTKAEKVSRGSIGSTGQVVVAPPPDVNLELVNLNTATAATEIWFNSVYHLKTFLGRATNLVARHPELSSHNPMLEVTRRAHVMAPPIDMNIVPHVKATMKLPPRDSKAIFIETRDADMRLLNAALSMLSSRNINFRLITVGPVEDLSDQWPRRTISETDDLAHVAGLLEAGVVLSAKPGATCDHQIIRGLLAGCRPVLPDRGVYSELLPGSLHTQTLYPSSNAKGMADRLQEAMYSAYSWHPPDFRQTLSHFEAIAACKAFDERLAGLAGQAMD
ncbi:MAG: glycosyl transferase group 1 [Phycisphaerales bacterium]|nr:glycosyl transferase group 1 [Phycisphaerales bacterium]